MPQLQPHQQRVLDEYEQLTERAHKLSAFTGSDTFTTLDLAERLRLVRQLAVMTEYRSVLIERVAQFYVSEAG